MTQETTSPETAVPANLSIDDPRFAYITNKWSRTIVQPLLIATLITALISAILVFAEIVTESDGWLAFGLFIFFVTLEGCYTTLWLKQGERRLLNHTAYRAAEFLLLLLLLRLFAWMISGNWPQWADLPDILRSPQLLILDTRFIWAAIFSLIAWDRAIRLASTFADLAIDQAEVYFYTQPQKGRQSGDKPVRTNRGAIVLSYFRQWISGALILAFFTAISSFDLSTFDGNSPLAIARLGLRPELLTFLLLYFLAGLALLSQAQLAALNARWLINDIVRTTQVEQRWHRYTLWLLGGIALVAAFLPIGSTVPISNLLQTIILGISTAVTFLVSLIVSLLGLFFSLFSGDDTTEASEPLVQPTLPPVPTPSPTPIPSALPPSPIDTGLILSSMFWAVAIVVTVIAVRFFLRERGVQMNASVLPSIWQRLQKWLTAAWQGTRHQVQDWQLAVRSRLQREPKEAVDNQPPWRFIRLNALSPREQIRYFYLSTVKRAANKGVPRQQAETPLEFAQDLKESWPEAEEDVDALTEAFLEARYGRSPIQKEDVNPVKKRWRQVKSSLRRRIKDTDERG